MKDETFVKDWGMNWAEGVLLGFARERIELNRATGMLRTAIKIIGKDKLKAIIETIEKGPVYLPNLSYQEKVSKFKPLKKAIELD
jgi:hypothetical protein